MFDFSGVEKPDGVFKDLDEDARKVIVQLARKLTRHFVDRAHRIPDTIGNNFLEVGVEATEESMIELIDMGLIKVDLLPFKNGDLAIGASAYNPLTKEYEEI